MTHAMTLGSDPEYVIKDSKGNIISAPVALQLAHDLEEPPQTKTRYGFMFADNANLELSIDYASTKDQWQRQVKGAIEVAHKSLEGFTIHAIPSLDYPRKQLQHPICRKFGCQPDYDAFKVEENIIPAGAQDRTFRTCGGHVHIGNQHGIKQLQTHEGRLQAVKLFELIAGTAGVMLDYTPESIKRRQLYGGAGAHRPKPYGVECRSQSAYWTQTPELVGFMWDASEIVATELIEQNITEVDLTTRYDASGLPVPHWLAQVINQADRKEACKYFKLVGEYYPAIQAAYEDVQHQANMDKNIPLAQTWNI